MRLFVRKVNQAEELLFFASASNLACSCLAWAFFSMACAEHCYLTALEFPHFKPAFFFLVVLYVSLERTSVITSAVMTIRGLERDPFISRMQPS